MLRVENEAIENTSDNVKATKQVSEIGESVSSSNRTEEIDILNQPLITQEKGILNENFFHSEGLGLNITYFDPWTVLSQSDELTCYTIDLCMLKLAILKDDGMIEIWIIQDNFKS
jgi:hypothetical protein